MIVVVDDRALVKDGYASLFGREGIPSTGFDPREFGEWVSSAADSDIDAVEAFLIGQGESTLTLPRAIRDRSRAPVIAMSDTPSLENTLALFDCGVDDVVRKPVHPREILARVAAIRRRLTAIANFTDIGPIRVFADGRDPEINGEVFALPRANVVSSNISSPTAGAGCPSRRYSTRSTALRRRRRRECRRKPHQQAAQETAQEARLRPIDSKRFLGYCIDWN